MEHASPAAFALLFFSGLLLANSIPHLSAGLRGGRFPTPFARPRGVATSSAVVNALWGVGNLALGAELLSDGAAAAAAPAGRLLLLLGFLVAALYTAVHFGRVRRAAQAAPDGDRLD